MSIRLWLIFESYIRDIRVARPKHLIMFEYLAAACLVRHVSRKLVERVVFCDPPHHGEARCVFAYEELSAALGRMRDDLKPLGMWPREYARRLRR